MSKNMVFPTLEPALPKLPNTLSKGYLDNCSGSIIERFSGTLIDFLGRLERFVIIIPECILRGSQAQISGF